MTIYCYQQITQAAQNAGFSGLSLQTIVAIALREAPAGNGCIDSQATNPQAVVQGGVNYGQAQGPLQFLPSTFYSAGISGSPYNLQDAFDAAYVVSEQGTNFAPWTCSPEECPQVGGNVVPTSPFSVFTGAGTTIGALYPNLFGMNSVVPPPVGPSNNNGQSPNIPPASSNGPLGSNGPLASLNPSTWGPAIGAGIANGLESLILGFKNSAINGVETIGIGFLGVVLIGGGILLLISHEAGSAVDLAAKAA